ALPVHKAPEGWTPPNWAANQAKIKSRVRSTGREVPPMQMVRCGSFWIIYMMMTIVAFGGLVLAIEVNRILNGVTRQFWGWVSDHIGRENAMFIAFMLEAAATFALLTFISRPMWFILLSGVTFFAWGEIFSLFPSITADLFGGKWATTNYGIVYTAKGTASIFAGPVAALASAQTGSWIQIFYIMIGCDIVAAVMALVWLKPLAKRTLAQQEDGLPAGETAESAA